MSSSEAASVGLLHHAPRSSVFESFSTTCKCIIGSGIMSLPYAFSQAGVVVGFVMLLLVALLSFGTMSQMIAAVHLTRTRLRRRKAASVAHAAAVAGSPLPEDAEAGYGSINDGQSSPVGSPLIGERAVDPLDLTVIEADPDCDIIGYQQVAYVACGEVGRVSTDAVLIFTQVGSCAAFLVLVLTNLQACLASYGIHAELEFIALPLAPIVLMLALPRSTTYLAPAAHFGNLTLLIGVGTIIFYGLTSETSQIGPSHPGGVGHVLNVISSLPAYSGTPFKILVFFGITSFAFAAHCEIVAVEADAQSSKIYARVLPCALAFIATLYTLVAVFAYASFGEKTNANILLNLGSSIFVNLVRIALSCTLLVNFSLALFPASQTLDLLIAGPAPVSRDLPHQHEGSPKAAASSESAALLAGQQWPAAELPNASPDSPSPILSEHLQALKNYHRKGDLVRLGEVCFTFGMSLYIRDLGVLFSLVGSVAGGILCFSMPAFFYWRVARLERIKLPLRTTVSIVAQLAFGSALIVMGIWVVALGL